MTIKTANSITTNTQVLDPVCGMTIDSAEAADSTEYNGETFYFCSEGCSAKFSADQGAYVALGKDTNDGHSAGQHAAAAAEPAGSRTTNTSEMEYTCPMHPQIVQIGPGSCPICGMALEPRVVSLDVPEDTAELDDMKRRFWVSLVLTLPIFLLETVGMFVRTEQFIPTTVNAWVQFVLASIVVLWGGYPFFERAWASVRNASPNMFTLIAMGTGAAWIYSSSRIVFSTSLSRFISRPRWPSGSLFRSRSRDHDACVARSGPGTQSP